MNDQVLLLTYQPKPKKLTYRQHKYKLNRLKGMSQYNAARAAGYSENTSKKWTKNIEKQVKTSLYDLLERQGLTDHILSEHLAKGLKAKKVVSVESDELNSKGQKIYVNVTVPDWPARHKYINTILELKGHKKEAEVIQNGDNNSVQILIINEGSDNDSKLCDSQAWGNSQEIEVGGEAISRISQPCP